jgi:hypothetical protein
MLCDLGTCLKTSRPIHPRYGGQPGLPFYRRPCNKTSGCFLKFKNQPMFALMRGKDLKNLYYQLKRAINEQTSVQTYKIQGCYIYFMSRTRIPRQKPYLYRSAGDSPHIEQHRLHSGYQVGSAGLACERHSRAENKKSTTYPKYVGEYRYRYVQPKEANIERR